MTTRQELSGDIRVTEVAGKIVIIDRRLDDLETMIAWVENAGLTAVPFADSVSALQKLQVWQPDVVICSLGATATTTFIRRAREVSSVPIMALVSPEQHPRLRVETRNQVQR